MGQGAPRPLSVLVSVFEPFLVPKSLGQAFVVLRSVSEDGEQRRIAGEERVESFPALVSLPVPPRDGKSAFDEGSFLEVEVVTAADASNFRTDMGTRVFSSVAVPLSAVSHVFQPQVTSRSGSCAVFWLGLPEDSVVQDPDLSRNGGEATGASRLERFEVAQSVGRQLAAPKVCVAIQCGEAAVLAVEAVDGEHTGDEVHDSPKSRRLDSVGEILRRTENLAAGLHLSLEEARSACGDHEAVQCENVQLRMSIEQQRERFRGTVAWLREQVREASTISCGSSTPEADAELERHRAELAELRCAVARLKEELAEQQGRAQVIQRHAMNARRAKDETMKLFEAKHKDVRWMGGQLAESGLGVERLRRKLELLKRGLDSSPPPEETRAPLVSPRGAAARAAERQRVLHGRREAELRKGGSPGTPRGAASRSEVPLETTPNRRNPFRRSPAQIAAAAEHDSIEDKVRVTLWQYEPFNGQEMDIRTEPRINADRVSHCLSPGDMLQIVEELPGQYGVLFLRLADGRGWVFDRIPGRGRLCERLAGEATTPSAGGSAEALPPAKQGLGTIPPLALQSPTAPPPAPEEPEGHRDEGAGGVQDRGGEGEDGEEEEDGQNPELARGKRAIS